jgi:hypothetical protein
VVDANVEADGTFTARTARVSGGQTVLTPGVPAGRYTVVYHPPGDGQKVGAEIALRTTVEVTAGDTRVELVIPEQLAERGEAVTPPTPR